MEGVTEATVPLRRVQLVEQEARAVAQALQATARGCAEGTGLCTDIYLDRPEGLPASHALDAPAPRVVLRDIPGEQGLLLSLEVERDGWLSSQRLLVPRARRWLVLGPTTARELFPLLPSGVAPALAVRCRRTVLRHPEGWWVCLDSAVQRWRTSAEALASARNELVEAVPALPGAVLALHGTGASVPAWLAHLLDHGAPCPDVFTWGSAAPHAAPPMRARAASAGGAARM